MSILTHNSFRTTWRSRRWSSCSFFGPADVPQYESREPARECSMFRWFSCSNRTVVQQVTTFTCVEPFRGAEVMARRDRTKSSEYSPAECPADDAPTGSLTHSTSTQDTSYQSNSSAVARHFSQATDDRTLHLITNPSENVFFNN